MKKRKTKKQRQRWWKNLNVEDKKAYIKRVQKKKEIKRRNVLRKFVGIKVTPETKDAWLKRIKAKNPWLENEKICAPDNQRST